MRWTSLLYQLVTRILQSLPVVIRSKIYVLIRRSGLPNSKFYRDLRYQGAVCIPVEEKSFKMIAYGGTIENQLFWKGIDDYLEPETIWIFRWLIANKKVRNIFDVGANTGLYSLLSCALDPTVYVQAFEPSKQVYHKLKQNIAINGFDIEPIQIALSNVSGKMKFYDSIDSNHTTASLSREMAKIQESSWAGVDEYFVDVSTLDDYVATHLQSKSLDFVKVDVELHEPEMFEGATETIGKLKPYVLFEVLLPRIARSLEGFFRSQDYCVFEFVKIEESYRLRKIDSLVAKPEHSWNYFACHSSKLNTLEKIIVNEG